MRTLGVDLSSQPRNTAACIIHWGDGTAEVESLECNVNDARILALHSACEATGIDAPFGWPRAFVEFVAALDAGKPVALPGTLNELYFRMTDFFVWRTTGKVPLAVAADKIAIPAMRCAGLLSRLGVTNKAGDGRVFEVYPAAALLHLGYSVKGLKDSAEGPAKRRQLLETMRETHPGLPISEETIERCSASDHLLDAFVASLATRAAKLGLTYQPAEAEVDTASAEGWIMIPYADSLAKLVSVSDWDR